MRVNERELYRSSLGFYFCIWNDCNGDKTKRPELERTRQNKTSRIDFQEDSNRFDSENDFVHRPSANGWI